MAKYLFEEAELTCVALEAELGLSRGAVREITVHPSGAVEVEMASALSAAAQTALKAALAKRGLPRGTKPRTG